MVVKSSANASDVESDAKIARAVRQHFTRRILPLSISPRQCQSDMNSAEGRMRERSPLLFLPFGLLDTAVLRRLDAPPGIFNGFRTARLTRHLQRNKNNELRRGQMF